MAWGARWPVLAGPALLRADAGARWAPAERVLAQWLDEPLSDPLDASADVAAVARRVLRWHGIVQQRVHLPAFQPGHAQLLRAGETESHLLLAVPTIEGQIALDALQWLLHAVRAIESGRADGSGPREQLRALAQRRTVRRPQGMNPYWFMKAAHDLDIPVTWVSGAMHRFGTGRNAMLLDSSFTERTPVLGTLLAQDKAATALVLGAAGLPAPVHALAADEEQAAAIALQLGYPVVVKPANLDGGAGVAAGLLDEATLRHAYRQARELSSQILVEKHFEGTDYRFTVFRGRILKVVVRRPGGVVGDGVHSVEQLVAHRSQDGQQQRRSWERGGKALLTLDEEARQLLAEQGVDANSVPAEGQFVKLRRTANVSTGGLPSLYEGEVHPDNARLVQRAAAALGLDVAGVDLIMPDLARSWFETGALVCEVNARPQIGAGSTPAIYREILNELVPAPTRVRVVLVIGEREPDAPLAGLRSQAFGESARSGAWLSGERLCAPQSTDFDAASILLAQREIDAALVHMRAEEVAGMGLPFDACDAVLVKSLGALAPVHWPRLFGMIAPHVRGPWLATGLDEPALAQLRAAVAGVETRPEAVDAAVRAALGA